MNLWEKYVQELTIFAPIQPLTPDRIDLPFNSEKIGLNKVPLFNTLGVINILRSFFLIPFILIKMVLAMHRANHIHIRCPNNFGLIACIAQILFPAKVKTVKYANNWDVNSKQPISYKVQQWILRNTFLTRNVTVLAYGIWTDYTKNIKPFFTASYSLNDKVNFVKPSFGNIINLAFVGTLTENKRPILALEVLNELIRRGYNAKLEFCGDGKEKDRLKEKAKSLFCESSVFFLGNVSGEKVRSVLMESHFLVFGSKSEGWPKAVAEAMWWGCIPVTTRVSCVPEMLDFGNRGVLCEPNSNQMANEIESLVGSIEDYNRLSLQASNWSRQYTIERFEEEIKSLLT